MYVHLAPGVLVYTSVTPNHRMICTMVGIIACYVQWWEYRLGTYGYYHDEGDQDEPRAAKLRPVPATSTTVEQPSLRQVDLERPYATAVIASGAFRPKTSASCVDLVCTRLVSTSFSNRCDCACSLWKDCVLEPRSTADATPPRLGGRSKRPSIDCERQRWVDDASALCPHFWSPGVDGHTTVRVVFVQSTLGDGCCGGGCCCCC